MSTTALWNEAQRSATSFSDSGAIFSASIRTAVLRPESEKSGSGRPVSGRGKLKRAGSPALRGALHRRSARIGQAEHLGGLVEGFADGVVDGAAELLVIADAAHRDQLGVAAGDQQQQIGEADAVGEARGQRMGFQMVHRDERLAGGQRDRLRRGEPDDDTADQPRPGRGGDAVEIAQGDAGFRQRALDDAVQHLDMGAGGDFRHHAAIGRMVVDLREHHIRQYLADAALTAAHHRRGGFVAGGLDTEQEEVTH